MSKLLSTVTLQLEESANLCLLNFLTYHTGSNTLLYIGKTALKEMWEKEKTLITNISSCSHNRFCPLGMKFEFLSLITF